MPTTPDIGTAAKDNTNDPIAAHKLDPVSPQAQALDKVADHIEDLATTLRTADLAQAANQATDMARRNPLLFKGGAAITGFTAARFLRARDLRPTTDRENADPWTTPYAGSRAYPATRSSKAIVRSQSNGGQSNG